MQSVDKVIQEQVLRVAQTVEQQLDAEIQKLDELDSDGIERIRQERLEELKKQAKQKQHWLSIGHGEYEELTEEKEFFEVTKKSPDVIVHFFKHSTPRCKIVDYHFNILCKKHIETRFCRLDVDRAPFLTQRLKIKMIPTIVVLKDNNFKDTIVGFTDLGNCDDFSTEILEWRLAQSGAINYHGDLLNPPDKKKKSDKQTFVQKKHTIRGRENDSSDDDFE
ncbi:thioredoxin domain-containing protein 9 [Homalodisca vitripennis]|uniref:thioredoxin domain-containing protein 9 n=1 Tax=Homalodisca vitripennis TaxID=197043 RepID=UPI001EEA40F0|nr:thioredoxin domain-containing protein 9 [Homalodisca vitripennis]XP_046669337.1 thioredoxin domain-containing protein 9 [Homalodisca vitripennis]XP_046669338.1 thioredoxin domain-containing protein 9 [Homalodisca vitripennis]